MSFISKVWVVTRSEKNNPEGMMPVKVFKNSSSAIVYIQNLEGFTNWNPTIPRIAYVGDEIYEHTEWNVE